MKAKFDVTGMTCSACSTHVEKSVAALEGASSVNVNLLQNSMTVEYDPAKLTEVQIVAAVEKAGYGALPVSHSNNESVKDRHNPMEEEIASLRHRLTLSVALLIPLMYVSMGHMMGLPLPAVFHGAENAMTFALTQFLLTLPIIYTNRKFFTVGFKTLYHRAPNMDSLIALGASAAMVYGVIALYAIGYGLGHGDEALVMRYSMDLYFESAATILTLITVGKFLEARSKGRTSDAIARLLDLSPKTATVERDGVELEIPAEEVRVGDIVIVKSGQSLPVDGTVTEGHASIDESALTGESLPVEKAAGDRVIGATINRSGYFKFRADKVGEDTTIARIIELVQDANATKAPIAKLADKVSGVFVPVVIGIALAATAAWLLLGHGVAFAVSIGIAVLVISCPCALGLATPTAIMVGTGKGAELGILFKSAESLETTHSVDTIVLDKTGTVTEGRPQVTDILPANGTTENELLRLAASLEKLSEHPLAQAIVNRAEEQGIALSTASNLQSTPGRGIGGSVDGQTIYAGNRLMMEELLTGGDTQAGAANELGELAKKAETLAQDGKTPLYFFSGNGQTYRALGLIALADVPKPSSREAIAALTSMGIEVVMLTGDNKLTAEAVRREMGIDRVVAEVLPEDKEREIRELQSAHKKVAMVGDGINDAPALARADVGIAIGAGTDVAIESADVVLMKSDLLDVVTAIQLSRAVIRNIKQNLFWAFFYNAIGIPLAAGVFYSFLGWKLNPMFAAAAMSLSSFCVVTNALRLKFFKPAQIKISHPTGQKPVSHKEESKMTKTMKIEGMTCGHCSARVEKALNGIAGVEAHVNLEKKEATVTIQGDVSDATLEKAVENAGYEVTSIQ